MPSKPRAGSRRGKASYEAFVAELKARIAGLAAEEKVPAWE